MKKLLLVFSLCILGGAGALCAMEEKPAVKGHALGAGRFKIDINLGEKELGYITYKKDMECPTYGDIEHVFVDEDFRGRGYGKGLVKLACKKLKEAGCSAIELEVKKDNLAARSLYEKLGFEEDEDERRGNLLTYVKDC